MTHRRCTALLVVGILLLAGCHRRSSSKPSPPTSTAPIRTGTGVIRGIITLSGKAPEMATIPNQPCHAGAPTLHEESVIVNDQGHLQNVIVYLESPPPAPPAANLPPITLDQLNCQYVPHVIALRTGQTLHVVSSDATLHNVHGECVVNEPFNFAFVGAGQSKDLTFAQPERFAVQCDVHPWMKAFVAVFDHPYFAVTGTDGKFEIRNVPPGPYVLVGWQERYGERRTPVTASDAQPTEATIIFGSEN